jgi:hypothetical protein
MWSKERLLNASVLQRVYFSNLIISSPIIIITIIIMFTELLSLVILAAASEYALSYKNNAQSEGSAVRRATCSMSQTIY